MSNPKEKTATEKAKDAAKGAQMTAQNQLTPAEAAASATPAGGAGGGYEVGPTETSYEHSPDAHRPTPEVAQQVDQQMGITARAPEEQPTAGADPAKVEAAGKTSASSSSTKSTGPKVKARSLTAVTIDGKRYGPNVLVEGSEESIKAAEKAGRVDTSSPAVRAVTPAANDAAKK